MADDDPDTAPPPPPTLESMFVAFGKFGPEGNADGSLIILSQLDSWMKQSKLFNKNFTLTDTGMTFSKFRYEYFYNIYLIWCFINN